jgi:hypothetical protein
MFDSRFDAEEWLDVVEFGAANVVEDFLGPRISVDPKDDLFCRAAFTGAATHIVLPKGPDPLYLKHYRGALAVGEAVTGLNLAPRRPK